MDNKENKQETQRIKAEALTKRTSMKKNEGKTQVLNKVNDNTTNSKKKVKFRDKHPRAVTIIKITIIILIVLFIIACGILAGTLFNSDVLKISEKELIINFENSHVYDINGNELATLSSGTKRKCISLSEMSEYLPKAYVAIEDERFYGHSGVDFKRTAKATLTYIFNGGKSSFGGSTITQQVVKNITQDKEDSAFRKVKEMAKALQVEKHLSKTQILELYLNLIFVGGDDINGVELGSIYYFDKSAKDLSIAECAFLAGINHTPNSYKPFSEDTDGKKYEKISKRTKTVLVKMKELEYITEEQYKEAITEVDNKLKFTNGDGSRVTTVLSYQTEAAINQIIEQMMEEKDMTRDMAEIALYSGGYNIYTTQDTNIQTILESELEKEKYATKSGEQVGMATMTIIDHTTGNVVASSGIKGAGEERTTKTKLGYMNYPKELLKPTGSAMKPLAAIAPGINNGVITAATVYFDGATNFGGGYNPKNYYSGFRGIMNVRQAIAISANIPNIKVLSNLGMTSCYKFLESVGIKVNGNEGLPLALGGFDGTSAFNMAAAYGAIANKGVYVEPVFYTKVEDKNSEIYIEPKTLEERSTRVMSEEAAYIVQSILTSVTAGDGGTARYCAIGGMDVAAKTGTTNGDYDRWLCGFTPYYSAACWFGYEKNAQVYFKHSPSNPAGSIWSSVMKQAHTGLNGKRFEKTENIISVNVCTQSGKLPKEGCPVYSEVFVKGTQPTSECDVHQIANICTDSGCIANEFCVNTEVKTLLALPEKEANNTIWSTNYGEQFVPLPELCTHKASDFKYND